MLQNVLLCEDETLAANNSIGTGNRFLLQHSLLARIPPTVECPKPLVVVWSRPEKKLGKVSSPGPRPEVPAVDLAS